MELRSGPLLCSFSVSTNGELPRVLLLIGPDIEHNQRHHLHPQLFAPDTTRTALPIMASKPRREVNPALLLRASTRTPGRVAHVPPLPQGRRDGRGSGQEGTRGVLCSLPDCGACRRA